jgi:hypothetical protein
VTTTAIRGYPLSGFVYEDTNLNLRRDEGEPALSLPLYVKLLDGAQPQAPALAAAAVDPVNGAYAFPAVAAGTYTLILDDNSTLTDVTPTQPTGWTGAEAAGGTRGPVAMIEQPLSEQNFGFAHAVPLRWPGLQ